MQIRRWNGVVGIVFGASLLISIGNDQGLAYQNATTCSATSIENHATPVVLTCSPVIGTPSATSSPIAVDGMTITLDLNSDQAGPVTMTVHVTDASGQPITDAAVVVAAEHLDMNMGKFPHDAVSDGTGTYVAEWVGMGMGGNWQIEVTVTRPDQEPITAFFRVEMNGLR